MSLNSAPSIIVFDVNETLLDLTTLEPVFDRLFGSPTVMREWFAQLILYAEAPSGSNVPMSALWQSKPVRMFQDGGRILTPQRLVAEFSSIKKLKSPCSIAAV